MTEPLSTPTRRSLLAAMAAAGAGLGCVGHALAWARSLSPDVLYEPPTKRRIGPPSEFPKGTTFLPEARVFLLKDEKGFRALSAVCTHLGCSVDPAPEALRKEKGYEYLCPCHGSAFAADGRVLHSPATEPLPWRRVSEAEDKSLVVDLASETDPDTRFLPKGGG